MISIAGRSYLLWIEVIAICAWLLVWEFPLVTNGLCGRAIATEFQESTLVDFDYSAVLTDLPCSGITTGLHWSAAAELGDESLSPWLSFADALYYDLMRLVTLLVDECELYRVDCE